MIFHPNLLNLLQSNIDHDMESIVVPIYHESPKVFLLGVTFNGATVEPIFQNSISSPSVTIYVPFEGEAKIVASWEVLYTSNAQTICFYSSCFFG